MFHGGSSFESSKGPRPLLPRAFRVACLIADVALKHPKAHLFFSGRRFLLVAVGKIAIANFLADFLVARCKGAATANFLAGVYVARFKDAATENSFWS